jgi:hypothetical protein
MIRNIQFGSTQILGGLYATVRDHNWETVNPRLEDLKIEEAPEKILITFTAVHRQDPAEFLWKGCIEIESRGWIRYQFDGKALSTFRRNRIGLCVLHGPTCAGQPCAVETVEGKTEVSSFPDIISPHQPFTNIRSISNRPGRGVDVRVRMEGDTFEMEDQRNWTDASFKSYCTPLRLRYPVVVKTGDRVRQSVTIEVDGSATGESPFSKNSESFHIRALSGSDSVLPPIGLATDRKHPIALTSAEIANLKILNPAHLRGDLHLGQLSAVESLRTVSADADAIGCGLELALHCTDRYEGELDLLLSELNQHPATAPIHRILVYSASSTTTPQDLMKSARERFEFLSPRPQIGGGTDANFTEINRERPDPTEMDVYSFSINPQVHVFDNLSLVETLPMQALVARSAATLSGRPTVVSPITLKPRFNPYATEPESDREPGKLPASVDPRQREAFAAAWTLGSLKYLAEAGVASITIFETVGWHGVMESEKGSSMQELFPSEPGERFPIFDLLSAFTGWAGADATTMRSSHPLRTDAVLLRRGNRAKLLIANFSQDEISGTIECPFAAEWSGFRTLTGHRSRLIKSGREGAGSINRLKIRLDAYAVISLDGILDNKSASTGQAVSF